MMNERKRDLFLQRLDTKVTLLPRHMSTFPHGPKLVSGERINIQYKTFKNSQ